jgi:hypothetical protein
MALHCNRAVRYRPVATHNPRGRQLTALKPARLTGPFPVPVAFAKAAEVPMSFGLAIACAGSQIPCDSITIMGCAVSPAGRTLLYDPTATQDAGRLQATDVSVF